MHDLSVAHQTDNIKFCLFAQRHFGPLPTIGVNTAAPYLTGPHRLIPNFRHQMARHIRPQPIALKRFPSVNIGHVCKRALCRTKTKMLRQVAD